MADLRGFVLGSIVFVMRSLLIADAKLVVSDAGCGRLREGIFV